MRYVRTLTFLGVAFALALAGVATGQVQQVVQTIVATTCAANQYVNVVAATGAATCGGVGTPNLSDNTASTAWTPTDASGAALAITNNSSIYRKIGNICIVFMDVTYPTTANGSTASIGSVPCTNDAPINYIVNGTVYSSGAGFLWYGLTSGSPTVTFFSSALASQTNTNMSTLRVRATFVFF